MTSWLRAATGAIDPQSASPFVMPGALRSKGQSGKNQRRSTTQIGRMWTESYPPFLAGSTAGRRFVAMINNFWRNGTTFDIDHYFYLTPNGLGTGSPQVNGASQTGSTLSTKLWTGSDPVLRGGDIISIAGISNVFDVTADAPNLAAGVTILTINPPIFAGGSPANNAAITYTGVRLNALIDADPNIPAAGPDTFIAGLTITFTEAV